MKRIISLLLIVFLLTGCTARQIDRESDSSADSYSDTQSEKTSETDATGKPTSKPNETTAPSNGAGEKSKVKQLIADNGFYKGMKVVSQKDHANGDRITDLGNFTYAGSATTPKWSLAQWDSGPCIWANRAESDKYTLTDGASKWVTYDPTYKSLLLRLNTEPYYKGNGAREGDYWPHLLIEQNFDYSTASDYDKQFYTGAADKWLLSFDLRLPYYSATPRDGDWVRAAQLYIYFGAHQKSTGRFIWFGVQLFDSRWRNDSTTNYFVDGGKADASGNMIYCVGMKELYKGANGSFWGDSSPQVTNDFVHFEMDMIPHLQAMVDRGIREGDLAAGTTVDDFYIDYMNYGWEIIGTFDCGVEIKNLSLVSYLE